MPTGIYKHSKEQDIHISEALKLAYANGRRPTGMKGSHQSPEAKEKIRKARIGTHSSVETRLRQSNSQKSIKNWNYKGGITPENKAIRSSVEYRLWRESVYARDGWTCQKCKIKGGKLNPHHLKNFAQYPELRFAIDNGITLCTGCHTLFHKIFGRQNNTREQIEEFLKQ